MSSSRAKGLIPSFILQISFLGNKNGEVGSFFSVRRKYTALKGTCCRTGFDRPWLSVEFSNLGSRTPSDHEQFGSRTPSDYEQFGSRTPSDHEQFGSRTPRITNSSVHERPRIINDSVYEQIFRTQSVSDDVLCLELRTRKPSTSWSDKLGVSTAAVLADSTSDPVGLKQSLVVPRDRKREKESPSKQ